MSLLINVLRCPRCYGTHGSMHFEPLKDGPMGVTHWAKCPATMQPILVTWQAERPAEPNALLVNKGSSEEKTCLWCRGTILPGKAVRVAYGAWMHDGCAVVAAEVVP